MMTCDGVSQFLQLLSSDTATRIWLSSVSLLRPWSNTTLSESPSSMLEVQRVLLVRLTSHRESTLRVVKAAIDREIQSADGVRVTTVFAVFIATVARHVISLFVREREGEERSGGEGVDCCQIHRLAESRGRCRTSHNIATAVEACRSIYCVVTGSGEEDCGSGLCGESVAQTGPTG
jgi:hypothetical protein